MKVIKYSDFLRESEGKSSLDIKEFEVIKGFVDEMPNLEYHNKEHALGVWRLGVVLYNRMRQMCAGGNLTYKQQYALEVAGLLHDIIYVKGGKLNEERSAAFAREFLNGRGVDYDTANVVDRIIRVTKMPQQPSSCVLERIICDCDLSNLGIVGGEHGYFESGQRLLRENNWGYNTEFQLGFVAKHVLKSAVGVSCFELGKQMNVEIAQELVDRNDTKYSAELVYDIFKQLLPRYVERNGLLIIDDSFLDGLPE